MPRKPSYPPAPIEPTEPIIPEDIRQWLAIVRIYNSAGTNWTTRILTLMAISEDRARTIIHETFGRYGIISIKEAPPR